MLAETQPAQGSSAGALGSHLAAEGCRAVSTLPHQACGSCLAVLMSSLKLLHTLLGWSNAGMSVIIQTKPGLGSSACRESLVSSCSALCKVFFPLGHPSGQSTGVVCNILSSVQC